MQNDPFGGFSSGLRFAQLNENEDPNYDRNQIFQLGEVNDGEGNNLNNVVNYARGYLSGLQINNKVPNVIGIYIFQNQKTKAFSAGGVLPVDVEAGNFVTGAGLMGGQAVS